LAFLLFVGHGLLLWNLSSGKKSLQAKREEVEANLKGTEEGGFSNMKEQFIGNTVILQEALIVENRVRHSLWNTIVGIATILWLLCSIWNLVLIARYTFVPGIIAFHPDAAKVAKDDFCGAWATVLVLRISILLSVLYLFLNLATVIHWLCDQLIGSSAFSNTLLKQARKTLKEHQLMTLRRQAKLKTCSSKGGGSEFKRITNSGLLNFVTEDPLNAKAKICSPLQHKLSDNKGVSNSWQRLVRTKLRIFESLVPTDLELSEVSLIRVIFGSRCQRRLDAVGNTLIELLSTIWTTACIRPPNLGKACAFNPALHLLSPLLAFTCSWEGKPVAPTSKPVILPTREGVGSHPRCVRAAIVSTRAGAEVSCRLIGTRRIAPKVLCAPVLHGHSTHFKDVISDVSLGVASLMGIEGQE